jgi:hypothetical protein
VTNGQVALDVADRRRRLTECLRAEWIAGAEEEWRKRTGRPMMVEELERVLRRYPGNLVDRPEVPGNVNESVR